MDTRLNRLPTLLALSAGLGFAACDAPNPEAPTGPLLRDSAGIQMVEYTALPAKGFGGWAVQETLEVQIGTMSGPEEEQLYRVSGARLLADSGIVVANGGSGDLRYFDGEGNYLRTEGRRGEGPGEYQQPSLVGAVAGDTLVVGDFRNNRVSMVHPQTGFIRSFRANESSGFGFTRGVLTDGTVLRGGGIVFGGDEELASGFRRDDISYELADPEGRLLLNLGSFPGPEMQVDVGEGFMSAMSVPFSRNTIAEAAVDRVILGTNDDYTLREYSPAGELIRIIRNLDSVRPVTEAMLDAVFEERIAEADDEDEERRLRSARAEQRTPETLPAFQSVLVDRVGMVWVQDYQTPLDQENLWTVFDRSGEILARVEVPEDLDLMDVGEDFLIGRVTDDLGVESVRLHRLDRNPTSL